MTRKKNKLLTFLWSLIPGAGEMYLGFFKMGTSLMALFLLLLSFSGFLNFYVLSLLSPVVWFYSFFHTNNLNSLPDEEFYALEDSYLLHVSSIRAGTSFFRSHRRFTAGCLILFGAAVLWNNLYPLICHNLLPFLLLPPSAKHSEHQILQINFLFIVLIGIHGKPPHCTCYVIHLITEKIFYQL
ncbi:TM2 domain [butyrate-producing bacterium SM4/1]|nr:TM2 domain [butyrate-producing bacterium SM4/1]